jgi:hypothetical protein
MLEQRGWKKMAGGPFCGMAWYRLRYRLPAGRGVVTPPSRQVLCFDAWNL